MPILVLFGSAGVCLAVLFPCERLLQEIIAVVYPTDSCCDMFT